MNLYKNVRVVYDAHQKMYMVQYRKWFTWHHDEVYKFDTDTNYRTHCRTQTEAKAMAIARAEALLETAVVWQKDIRDYYG